ncbi:hypothetical protein [Zooshikella sp. RANM57]|uniref:hypothetical protein n=1 Tax=Zooshikella sp. RANM57 TaxID=3425863 RepID=UPI003D6FC3D2
MSEKNTNIENKNSISHQNFSEEPNSFESIRQLGIDYAQKISGKLWSDYNLSDPGVTLLELLCYEITDLIYRAESTVENILTNESMHVDYHKHALFSPDEVFSARSTTLEDYKYLLLDQVNEINNIWIYSSSEKLNVDNKHNEDIKGLYYILVEVSDVVLHRSVCRDVMEQTIKDRVLSVFNANRNISEDLAKVIVVENNFCELYGKIEIKANCDVDLLIADIYCMAGWYINNATLPMSYFEAYDEGESIEEIFTGPLLDYGVYHDLSLKNEQSLITVSKLFHEINQMDGVNSVNELDLVGVDYNYLSLSKRKEGVECLKLKIPKICKDINIVLVRDNVNVEVGFERVKKLFNEKYFSSEYKKNNKQIVSQLYALPSGVCQNIYRFNSIKNSFPSVYCDLARNNKEQSKVFAKQFDAYLLLFDQILANTHASFENIKTLFSVDMHNKNSYFFYPFDNQTFPGISSVYPENFDKFLKKILVEHDDYFERKGRLIDYLLSLYGEEISPAIFSYFNNLLDEDELDELILTHKINYLRSIIEISKNRAGGFDYQNEDILKGTAGGFQLKISFNLGMKISTAYSLTEAIHHQSLEIVFETDEQQQTDTQTSISLVNQVENIQRIPRLKQKNEVTLTILEKEISSIIPIQSKKITKSLLVNGININYYGVSRVVGENSYNLIFSRPGYNESIFLGKFKNKKKAILAANYFRSFLLYLHQASDGLHVVEHILLRDINEKSSDADFYNYRISILFPNWTLRCQQLGFKEITRKIVQIHCPVHIRADCYWLNVEQMSYFEQVFKRWLVLRSNKYAQMKDHDNREYNQVTCKLVKWLQELRQN